MMQTRSQQFDTALHSTLANTDTKLREKMPALNLANNQTRRKGTLGCLYGLGTGMRGRHRVPQVENSILREWALPTPAYNWM